VDEILRAAINIFMFCAAPHKALPRAKNARDRSMTGLRPKVSARAPESGRIAVLARAYAEPTQTKLSLPLRSWVMVGRTVPVTVRSRALRNKETTSAMNVSQNAWPFLGFVPVGIGAGATASESIDELQNGGEEETRWNSCNPVNG
jgi:hypothetical protein